MVRQVALVEDEAAIRDNYSDALQKQGYEVRSYADRDTAMAAFRISCRLTTLARFSLSVLL